MDSLRDELMADIHYDDDEHIFNQENAKAHYLCKMLPLLLHL